MKIKCVKIECEVCHVVGSCQVFSNNKDEIRYGRVRHYDKVVAGKPKFIYHAQTLSYVSAQLEKLNQQNLSSSKDSNTVALGSSGACDQYGHSNGIHRPNLSEIGSESKSVGWSSSLVRTLALRAKGRRSESGSAHHQIPLRKLHFGYLLARFYLHLLAVFGAHGTVDAAVAVDFGLAVKEY